ncbi:MAG: MBOAT family O-acyltransferase [Sphingobacteriales bacterium]
MLFNSLEFIVFFPVVTFLYFLVPHSYRWLHLLIASCIFYAAFIPSYLLILLLLILIDFSSGILIEKSTNNKKIWLITSITANIGLLCVFKYYNFFIGNINSLTSSHFILLNWALPIGLSFHTFQSMSYTIEVYRGKQKAIHHFGYYALYVMFYPQLVAGPIERPYHLFPQFFATQKFSSQKLYEGLRLMAWGFFKKLVIADRISEYSDTVFKYPSEMNAGNIWMAIFYFAIQIYADFSGYSDIAIGAARCMGIDLMINFNRPYLSVNIRDFWTRWHISLSSWFRDYFYIPLGGNRKGVLRKRLNVMATFTLSGFWHGAGWTFIVWGILHGVYLITYDFLSGITKQIRIWNVMGWLITGICVGFAWIFFRASSLENAFIIIRQSINLNNLNWRSISGLKTINTQYGNFTMLFIFACIGYMFVAEKFTTPLLLNLNEKKITDIAFFSINLLTIIFFGMFTKTSFIYFQF